MGSLRVLLSGGLAPATHTRPAISGDFQRVASTNLWWQEVGPGENLAHGDNGAKVRSVGRPVIGMFVELRDERE